MSLEEWNKPNRINVTKLKNRVLYEVKFVPELPENAVVDLWTLDFPFDQLEIGDYFVVEIGQVGYKFLNQNVLRANKNSKKLYGEEYCKKFAIRVYESKPTRSKMVVRTK